MPDRKPDHTRTEPITRDSILTAAVTILDREGAEALTMRRLARELGVEAPSLYHHFPNKRAILDGVVDRIVAEAVGGQWPEPSDDWREMMRAGIGAVRRALLAHPNATPLVVRQTNDSPAALTWIEGPLRILFDAGLRGDGLVSAYHAIAAYTFGWHILAFDAEMGVWRDGSSDAESAAPLEAVVVTTSVRDRLGDWSGGFEEGLDVLLDGIEARLRG